ncbi:MAG: hypothetical protein NUV53_02955 [Patescibacteria group bacterium]|nr:hypothetical protein [Patescibacteria group bacterium]
MNSETKNTSTSSVRACQNCKTQFTIEPEDFDFYKKIDVPPPTFCPLCRMQRRMAFRNERSLYKDTCDLCEKQIISLYSPNKPFKVYCRECWNSDSWDPLQYGVEYDWNKPFFPQFRELMEKVPRIALVQLSTNINCDYANYVADCKNIYLSQSSVSSENVFYSYVVDKSFDIFDCSSVKECAQCYENVECARNNHSKFLFRSRDCIDSLFLFDCVNCQNCFMSSNLRNKQFVVRNVQYSKEEYMKQTQEIHTECYQDMVHLKEEFLLLIQKGLHRFANLIKTTECTGDNIFNAKNVHYSFEIPAGENLKFCIRAINIKDSYDVTGAVTGELIYEVAVGGHEGNRIRFLSNADILRDVEYSDWCKNSSYLFGCVSVKDKQYCIFNKQYTKKEYEKLRKKIIQHMEDVPYVDSRGNKYMYGEFFPTEFSPFAYNESMAYEHIPLAKDEVCARGYVWRDSDPSPYSPTIAGDALLDDIESVKDSVINEIIGCVCGKAYRILKSEFEFLKREKIALPRKCPECRHKERFAMRNPMKLWRRQCACLSAEALAKADVYRNTVKHPHHPEGRCPNEFETSYAPDRQEIIYCESCYQSEVI